MGPPLLPLLFENGCPPPEAGLGDAGASESPPSGELLPPYDTCSAEPNADGRSPDGGRPSAVGQEAGQLILLPAERRSWQATTTRLAMPVSADLPHTSSGPGPTSCKDVVNLSGEQADPGDLRLMASGGQRSVRRRGRHGRAAPTVQQATQRTPSTTSPAGPPTWTGPNRSGSSVTPGLGRWLPAARCSPAPNPRPPPRWPSRRLPTRWPPPRSRSSTPTPARWPTGGSSSRSTTTPAAARPRRTPTSCWPPPAPGPPSPPCPNGRTPPGLGQHHGPAALRATLDTATTPLATSSSTSGWPAGPTGCTGSKGSSAPPATSPG